MSVLFVRDVLRHVAAGHAADLVQFLLDSTDDWLTLEQRGALRARFAEGDGVAKTCAAIADGAVDDAALARIAVAVAQATSTRMLALVDEAALAKEVAHKRVDDAAAKLLEAQAYARELRAELARVRRVPQ